MPQQHNATPVGERVVTTCGGCASECAFFATPMSDGSVKVETPVPGHPCGATRLCGRGRRRLSLPRLEDDRVEHPLRRTANGEFEPISWEQAYREIAQRMHQVIDEYGPTSLAMTTGVPSYHWRYGQRLLWALGSPNLYTVDAACQASRVTAWLHVLGYSPETDLANTDYVVYFGRSPMDAASVTMADEVRALKTRGAHVAVVDPRRNSTVDYADLWLKVRPGHDLAVLLGIAHVLIEEDLYDHDFVQRYTTGFDEFARALTPYDADWAAREADVPKEQILELARGLGNARPRAVVDCGFHGGLGVAYLNSTQTTRMVALVDALLGSYGKVGGALNPPTQLHLGTLAQWAASGAAGDRTFPEPAEPTVAKVGFDRYPLADPVDGLCTTIGESIEMGQIHGLIAYASNPATGYGNARDWIRMLSKLDLLVAIDLRMSETARIADYVLPEVSYLEADRGVALQGSSLIYRNRVLDLIHPDTRPADQIFSELAVELGVGRYFDFTPEDVARAQVAPFGIDLDQLRAQGYVDTDAHLPLRTGDPVILTPDNKIAFASDLWGSAGLGRTPCWQAPLVEPAADEFRLIGGNNPFASHTSSQALASGSAALRDGHADESEQGEKGGLGSERHAPSASVDTTSGASEEPVAGASAPDSASAPDRDPATDAGSASGNSPTSGGVSEADDRVPRGMARPRRRQQRARPDYYLSSVWMHQSRAEQLGIHDGDVVEVSSPEGSDRAVAHVTLDLHPSALFTSASPGARSGNHATSRKAVDGQLGVGPLDHTPLRVDQLSGAALTQENVVSVRRISPEELAAEKAAATTEKAAAKETAR